MTLEDAIAIKLATMGLTHYVTPNVAEHGQLPALLSEAEGVIAARFRLVTGVNVPPWRPGSFRDVSANPPTTFYSVVKTPTGYEYRREPPARDTLDHLGFPESKEAIP